MKKLLCGLLGLALLTACDKDEVASVPKQGQFIAEYENIKAAVNIGSQVSITIYTDGSYTYQDINGRGVGSWPEYVYSFSDKGRAVELHCTYADPQNFKATCTGEGLPATLHFHYDGRVLDANGDGILD